MYSKVKVLGHPVHPMLVAYPIALYTATLVSYVVFVLWGHGDYAWMKLAIAANVGGVAMAAVAAVPGLVDWATGIPAGSPARRHGLVHLALNAAALGLFLIDALLHVGDWQQTNHPHTAAGVILAALGVLCTIGAGFFG
ncbi:MAG: hypothetical protein JOZ41_01385 [Chloroflexi bacterium]|nr:hypothetical protein [Chloroflexota bacterium]